MHRWGRIGGAVAAMAATAGLVIGAAPAHALGTVVATVAVSATGAPSTVNLAPGIYLVTASGTYNYDNVTPGSHLADAFCSTGDFKYWSGTLDGVGHTTTLEPGTISEWQPARYGFGSTPGKGLFGTEIGISPFTGGQPFDQVLELQMGGHFTPWVGVPSVQDPGGAATACDTKTHTYNTLLLHPGGAVSFQIRDTNYVDNSGSLSVTIASLPQ